MEYEELNNAASRLLHWLKIGQGAADEAAADEAKHQHDGKREKPFRVGECWALIWDLDLTQQADHVEYARRGVALIDAAAEVRHLVGESDNSLALMSLVNFDQVEIALRFLVESKDNLISTMMGSIQPTGWHSLESTAHLLATEQPEATLPEADYQDLLSQAHDLIADVLASDLPGREKRQLLRHLRDFETSLIRITLAGSEDVVRATDGLNGLLYRLCFLRTLATDSPTAQAIIRLATATLFALHLINDVDTFITGSFGQMLGLPPGSATPPPK